MCRLADAPAVVADTPPALPGVTCWRRAHAARAAFRIDGAAYFAALASALERAEHQVLVLGWDLGGGIRLRPQPEAPTLRELLDAAVRRHRRLRVYLLEWDYALPMALERGFAPWIELDWRTHRRVRFRLDDTHPYGGCHHQKLVVVDDALACVGGIDLAPGRWDTPEHPEHDARRTHANGTPAEPVHDVQMLVDGEAARALGDLARARWRRATGERLRPPPSGAERWPAGVEPDVRDVELGIARTAAAWRGEPAVREIETLHLAAIARARHSIYVENQYLTARSMVEALSARLREPHGPEIVVVVPSRCANRMEELVMGGLRDQAVRALRAADAHGRLRVFSPRIPGAIRLNVHSKLAIVDGTLLCIGSANLTNRSMRLDTECDVVLEAVDRAGVERDDVASALAGLRSRLLAEHLGTRPASVEAALAEHGSLIGAIESLRGGPRSLEPLALGPEAAAEPAEPPPAEPEGMPPFASLVDAWRPDALSDPHRRWLLPVAAASALCAAALLLWVAAGAPAPPRDALRAAVGSHPAGFALAVASFALAALAFVPVTALGVAAIALLGPLPGAAVAGAGAVVAALVQYGVGRRLLGEPLRRLTRPHLARIRERLDGEGTLGLVRLRLSLLAPFASVSLVAGAGHVALPRYLAATTIAAAIGAGVLGSAAWALERLLR